MILLGREITEETGEEMGYGIHDLGVSYMLEGSEKLGFGAVFEAEEMGVNI